MNTFYKLDLSAAAQRVTVTVNGATGLVPEFADTLDDLFRHVAALVNAQGFSASETIQALSVEILKQDGDKASRRYTLSCESLHPSVWRVLSGLLHTFDVASAPLRSIRFEGSGKVLGDKDVLRISYPAVRQVLRLNLERGAGAASGRSVEVEFAPGIKPGGKKALMSVLDAWLEVSSGGFFVDGAAPVTNAHDCPSFESEGRHLAVARFEIFEGSESAFDVLVNLLGQWQHQTGLLASVRIY